MRDIKSFGAFVLQAAKLNIRAAKSVALYIGKRGDRKFEIDGRIVKAHVDNLIDVEYRDTLLNYANELDIAYGRFGRFVDVRDPKDWESLGNGARMKKKHIEEDASQNTAIIGG